MDELTFLSPYGTIHIVITADMVTVAAPQRPAPAEWDWAMHIARECSREDLPPRLFFEEFFDIWEFPRL